MAGSVLDLRSVERVHGVGPTEVRALSGLDLRVDAGEFVAVMGPSGSGKSTLLQLAGGLDAPTSGQVVVAGADLSGMSVTQRAVLRRRQVGYVFQDFNLLDTFSLRDNILLPLVLFGMKYPEMEQRLDPLAKRLGIEDQLDKYPYEVSGGQKQRAAVARALITMPEIILADEPTGALDSRSSDELLDIFNMINRAGQTVVMVTHSVKAASRAGRVLFIRDGEVFHQLYRAGMSDDEMYRKISDTLTVLTSRSAVEKEAI